MMPSKKSTKPRSDPEYRLLVIPRVSERTQRPTTLVVLETTKAFATFRYELSVKAEATPSSLHLTVLGFRTPQLSLPSAGPARFEQEYADLNGAYEVTIQGIDGRTTAFALNIAPGSVALAKKPRASFVTITTDLSQWHNREF
jgi:hypothetical protein